MIAVIVRAGALALALAALALLLGAMGAGVGAVLVELLVAAAIWAATLLWAREDARRSPASGPLLVRWTGVTALLVVVYVCAGQLAPGSYGEEMSLAELVTQSAVLGGVLVLLPAALGIAVCRVRRRG